jgi:L-aminopeptidase/D-esterase-like protein
MACFEFKGGIGTASCRVGIDGHAYAVGMMRS